MKTFATKLKVARVAKDLKQEDIASFLDVTKQAVSLWEKGQARPYAKSRRRLENFLDLEENYLEDNYVKEILPTHRLPVLGYATAGLLETQYQEELGYIEVPEEYSDTKKYMCIKVSGDSMDKILPHGAYAVFNKTEHNYRNKPVLVEVNNETTIKHISESSSMVILTPNSNNPIHQPIYIDKNNIDELKIYGTLSWHCVDWEK